MENEVFVVETVSLLTEIISVLAILIYLSASIAVMRKSTARLRAIIYKNNLYMYMFATHRLIFYGVAISGCFTWVEYYPIWMNIWSMAISLQLFFSLAGIAINDISIYRINHDGRDD